MITFVVGATGAGKSAWAMREAERAGGLILNADSVQVYRYFDIGSAKPTLEDRARVRHELYDIVSPDDDFTAGEYRREALAVLEREADRREVFIVGGSGFYLQALENGMYDVPKIDETIRARVAEWESSGEMWAQLKKVDPPSADRLPAKDSYRVRRALEATLMAGRPWSEMSREIKHSPHRLSARFSIRKIGIQTDRERLRDRIVERTRQMFERGLLDEVKSLIDRGYEDAKPFNSVGYIECKEYLAGRLQRADLESAIVTSTMRLAKKQMTWFRRDQEINWLP